MNARTNPSFENFTVVYGKKTKVKTGANGLPTLKMTLGQLVLRMQMTFREQRLFYSCLFYSCPVAHQILLENPELTQKWTTAVDWLKKRAEPS
jgi:hypothetical protein